MSKDPRAHWPAWIMAWCGHLPDHATMDYAAHKAVNAMEKSIPGSILVTISGNTWLIVGLSHLGFFNAYPVDGGARIPFTRIGNRIVTSDRSKGGARCCLLGLRRAIAKHFPEEPPYSGQVFWDCDQGCGEPPDVNGDDPRLLQFEECTCGGTYRVVSEGTGFYWDGKDWISKVDIARFLKSISDRKSLVSQ